MTNAKIKKLTVTALMCALAYALMLAIHIPVAHLTYDPKEVVITLAGLVFGPLAALFISAVVALLEMITVSSTGYFGFIMNFASSAFFSVTVSLVYKKFRSLRGAQTGLAAAVMSTTALMLLLNYLIAPLYFKMPVPAITEMMLPLLLPFNLLKYSINSTLIALLYKPFVSALRRAQLLPRIESASPPSKKTRNISLIISAILLIGSLILIFVLKGIQ